MLTPAEKREFDKLNARIDALEQRWGLLTLLQTAVQKLDDILSAQDGMTKQEALSVARRITAGAGKLDALQHDSPQT